jgi:hypothetical protein
MDDWGRLARSPLRMLAVTNMWPGGDDPPLGAYCAVQMRSVETCGVHIEAAVVTTQLVSGCSCNLRRGIATSW